MTRSRIAWALAVLDVIAFLGTSLHPSDGGIGATILYAVGIASFAGMGALLVTRVPENPIGVLLLASGTVLVAAIAIGGYADVGALQVPPWPGSGIARLIGDTMFIYPFVIALIGVPLVFPDGRLPSPRFRWIVRITIADMVAWSVLGTLVGQEARKTDPVLVALAPVFSAVESFILVATLASFGAALVAVWLRFRRGDPVQRQQIKWLAAVVALAAAVIPLSLLLTDSNPDLANALSGIAVLTLFALPVVIAIAVLRYRLYEIDRIISRTIGWVLVTAILAAVFAAVIVGLQAVLAPVTDNNTLTVAASTLVAAALFQPLRRRVQHAVDRRFNRSRVDADRTIAAFARQVRDEVDLATLRADLVATAGTAVSPSSAAAWLRETGR
jgi:hypothetical protein